jgi:oligopeptide/dipeptide ABC transporter ATP-binding protein
MISARPSMLVIGLQDPRHPLRGNLRALNPPPGCHFHLRCPLRAERCTVEVPALDAVAAGHRAACHFRERTD